MPNLQGAEPKTEPSKRSPLLNGPAATWSQLHIGNLLYWRCSDSSHRSLPSLLAVPMEAPLFKYLQNSWSVCMIFCTTFSQTKEPVLWHSNRPVTMTHWSYQTLCQVKVDNLKEQWGLSTEGSAKAPVQRWVSAGFKCFALVCEIFAESTALMWWFVHSS